MRKVYALPRIIFIHCVKQHIGTGGESVIADGLFGAELLRKEHPEAFEILTTTDSYFWDKGHANFSWETDEFYKISKFPTITLNSNKEVIRVAVNNAIRDSYLDLPSNKVKKFYEAMKLFNDILYATSSAFKMDSGDLMTLDNVRCLHGREEYEAFSDRHIESSYLDWDEARCRRRKIQEKLGLLRMCKLKRTALGQYLWLLLWESVHLPRLSMPADGSHQRSQSTCPGMEGHPLAPAGEVFQPAHMGKGIHWFLLEESVRLPTSGRASIGSNHWIPSTHLGGEGSSWFLPAESICLPR
ncbi:gamma-butyrobetaine dioxygenase-like [Macrobrachium rosenbergii]|uniref:gamma-butyrobetaine dioxygenase-like n=1 Tax=Macrobrachium rosenbergii TaxID=79674 RepID=UPI0034D5D13E